MSRRDLVYYDTVGKLQIAEMVMRYYDYKHNLLFKFK